VKEIRIGLVRKNKTKTKRRSKISRRNTIAATSQRKNKTGANKKIGNSKTESGELFIVNLLSIQGLSNHAKSAIKQLLQSDTVSGHGLQ